MDRYGRWLFYLSLRGRRSRHKQVFARVLDKEDRHQSVGAVERQRMRNAIHRTAESPIRRWPNLGSRQTAEIDPSWTYDIRASDARFQRDAVEKVAAVGSPPPAKKSTLRRPYKPFAGLG